MTNSGLRRGPSAEAIGLIGLYVFTGVALLGYGFFGLRPQNLPALPWAIEFYQVSFPIFARAHIVVSALALAIAFFKYAGTRWLPAFGVVFVLSFLAEHIGTGYGFPFSGYEYTGLLGPRLLDRVPWLIPVSWFLMAGPAWVIARRVFPGSRGRLGSIVFATWLLVLWDLALDPAMSHLTTYWLWENPGQFYGMPWVNLLGWFGTGLVLMSALSLIDDRLHWSSRIPGRWAALYYLAVLLMPLGMVTLAGLWGSTFATLGALGLAAGVARVRGAFDREGSTPGGEPRAASPEGTRAPVRGGV